MSVAAEIAAPTGRLACVGVDLTEAESATYALVSERIAELEDGLDDAGRLQKRSHAKLVAQRTALLRDSESKSDLLRRVHRDVVAQVLPYAMDTVEDPRHWSYDGSLDEARRGAEAHQIFPRGASLTMIDLFLTSEEWVTTTTPPPLAPPEPTVVPVVVRNVFPFVLPKRRRRQLRLLTPDVLPPFVRLQLPRADVCTHCTHPRGWMGWCSCPVALELVS